LECAEHLTLCFFFFFETKHEVNFVIRRSNGHFCSELSNQVGMETTLLFFSFSFFFSYSFLFNKKQPPNKQATLMHKQSKQRERFIKG